VGPVAFIPVAEESVEQIDEEEDDDNFECATAERGADVELECGLGEFADAEALRRPVDLAEDVAGEQGPCDADEDGGADFEDLQDRDEQEAEKGECGAGGRRLPEGYYCV
jgi:hypothetical protein